MPEWIIAMFLIGALLSAGDMAKIFLEARRSRREAAVYDNHPQKLQMEHYADSFRVLAESFYQMPSKSDAGDGPGGQDSGKRTAGSL